jgi:hypothetical protein
MKKIQTVLSVFAFAFISYNANAQLRGMVNKTKDTQKAAVTNISAAEDKVLETRASDFTNQLGKELNLTATQLPKVKAAAIEQFKGLADIEKQKLEGEAKTTAKNNIFSNFDEKMKTILTVAQFTKYGPAITALKTKFGL